MQLVHPASAKAQCTRFGRAVDAVTSFIDRGLMEETSGTTLIASARVLTDIDQLMRLTMLDPHSQSPQALLPQPLAEAFAITSLAELDALIAKHAAVITRLTETVLAREEGKTTGG